jgi:hypothetical protein
MKKLQIETDYRPHRAASYPPTGEALDAIAKGFRALMGQGMTLPPETVAWVEACEAVKAKFKKPKT